jgi:hypothetical protein
MRDQAFDARVFIDQKFFYATVQAGNKNTRQWRAFTRFIGAIVVNDQAS